MNAIRGRVELLGRDRTDNLIEMFLAVIDLARRDATGRVIAEGSPGPKAYWQLDAIEFLQSLEELKTEIMRR